MKELLAVFCAGGLGACLRLLVGRGVDTVFAAQLPNAGTLAANLIGCFVIGLMATLLPDGVLRVAILTGLLGGFTTYSAFALLTVNMATSGRWSLVATQLALHLVGGVICVLLGIALARALGGGAA